MKLSLNILKNFLCKIAISIFDVLQESLLTDLQELARPRHVHWDVLGLMTVRNFIKNRLSQYGQVIEHCFESSFGEGINYIIKIPGQNKQLDPLLIGAHYDGPPQSIGADDNASGVAALLSLAQFFSETTPKRTIWLIAFDQEEWGMMGSKALAKELKESNQKLKLMISLEMLAYTSEKQDYPLAAMKKLYGDKGDFIALVANTGCAQMLPGLAKKIGNYVPTKVLPIPLKVDVLPDARLSDHSSFWDQGYNAMMITDTSFLRNPHYHEMTDTVETLDLNFFGSLVEGLKGALINL